MKRNLFLFLFGLAIFTAIFLPRLLDLSDSIQIPLTGVIIFVLVPLLNLWRMTYLGWSKKEKTNYFNPFKTSNKYWDLFFGIDRV
jgi:hypothetical protein